MEIGQFIKFLGKGDTISIDTRTLKRDDIFFALKGENFDGNKFIPMALDKGAALVVSDDQDWSGTERVLIVSDVLSFMQKSANAYRNSLSCKVIGITGSNGKTTTKELCHSVVGSTFRSYSTRGNYNNHIGVPYTLLSLPRNVEVAIVEMGANHQGEIDFLCRIANPEIGIITNIGKAHLEGFGGIEGVKKGKSELYRYISERCGTIIYNDNDEVLKSLIPEGVDDVVSYVDGKIERLNPSIKMHIDGHQYESHLFGDYNAVNIICAVTLGKYLGIDHDAMKNAIKDYNPRNNRSEILLYKGARVVKDAYNANPSSVESSLLNFIKSYTKNSVVILGDMLELGEESRKEHKAILSILESENVEHVILIGPIFQSCDSLYPSFNSVEDAKDYFDQLELEGRNIFIKGSRGLKLEGLLRN